MTIKYEIEFFSDWHLSSGLSVAGDVDAAVIKTEDNMPYIPGKTLKGMLRHAADSILAYTQEYEGIKEYEGINEAFVEKVFGLKTAPNDDVEKTGQCFFSNAYLPDDLQKVIQQNKQESFLYRKISSTAIDSATGIAENQTLRKIEVCIPLVLSAYIADVAEEDEAKIKLLFQLVKRMGLQRHRGFGRCAFRACESVAD
jgi:CRISPR/Cas system CSM-associated protein Csm3 (group 7 of RAMP superfamily)